MGAKIYFLSKSASERIFFPVLLQLPVNEEIVRVEKVFFVFK
jgi:hypothetical protein